MSKEWSGANTGYREHVRMNSLPYDEKCSWPGIDTVRSNELSKRKVVNVTDVPSCI